MVLRGSLAAEGAVVKVPGRRRLQLEGPAHVFGCEEDCFAAVEARERALEEAIEGAKRDREEAARALAEQLKQIEAARLEAQKIIVEGRQTGEKLRATMIEETHQQQQAMLERARREIGTEKENAIAELRREAIELAIAGASKVIEKNLDDQSNRKIVESFLASIPVDEAKRG